MSEKTTPGALGECPTCGRAWHAPECPELKRKERAAAWMVLPLVLSSLALSRLGGESTASTVIDFLVVGVACGVIGTVIRGWVRRRDHD